MLLALSKATIHLPLSHDGRKVLLQFQVQGDGTLLFYMALDHLGPLRGVLSPTEIHIATMYEKSFHYLQKESPKLGMITHITLQEEISPLFDLSDIVLDLKG
jgi:hypothetical protein